MIFDEINENGNMQEVFGVFISNLFLTSGHVIDECIKENNRPYIKVNGVVTPLDTLRQEYYKVGKNLGEYDLAVYSITDYWSELSLAPKIPRKGDKVLNRCIEKKSFNEYEVVENEVEIDGSRCGLYFGGFCDALKPGFSGSPVFQDGKVVGITSQGNKNEDGTIYKPSFRIDYCLFLSSEAIIKLLRKLGLMS